MRLGIVGASRKLGQYLIKQALAQGHQIDRVCQRESVRKLDRFCDRITIFPEQSDDPLVIGEALAACDPALTVVVPWDVNGYSTGTAIAVWPAPSRARAWSSPGVAHLARRAQPL